jgi:hypothetical protein
MNWRTPLAEPIALSAGDRQFVTLRDAAEFLTDRYSKARGGVLAGTIEDLIVAAENPTPDRVRRATDQFARFLADENLITSRASTTGSDLEQRIRDMLLGRRSTAGQAKVAAGVKRRRKREP